MNLVVIKAKRLSSIASEANVRIGYIFLLLLRTKALFWLVIYALLGIS
jgi:hypothetical protein